MSDQPTGTGNEARDLLEREARLDRALRAALLEERQEAQERGGHPEPEELLAYQERQLPAERQEEIAEHLSLCPQCMHLVLDLAAFDEVEFPAEDGESAERAGASDAPLPFRPPHSTETPVRRAGGLPAWSGWAAAVVVVVFAGLAAVLFLPHGEPPTHVGWVYLSPEGPTRSAGSEEELELPPGAQYLTLVLGGAWTEEYDGYRVEILGLDGTVAWSTEEAQRAQDGTVSVLVPRAQLPSGTFEVRLSGRTEEGWEPVETYSGRYSKSAAGSASAS